MLFMASRLIYIQNPFAVGISGNRFMLHLSTIPFVESNPIPVKSGLNLLGHLENVLRLPLTTSTDETNDDSENLPNDVEDENNPQ